MKNKSGLIWITGFSSSGKTTLARIVCSKLLNLGYNTIHLDGDDLRKILGKEKKYDRQSRIKLAKIYFKLCKYLSVKKIIIVISSVSMFDELYLWVKKHIPNSLQVYLKVPEKIRRSRDLKTKKIYLNNNLNNDEYDIPQNPDLIIQNYDTVTRIQAAKKIIKYYLNE
tara:strand:+ start:542 stop:1045 length:504 start_codon:yes stop_codon:yes gene_type:complete